MTFEKIGGVELYRPQIPSELMVRAQVQKHLYSKYSVGEYRGAAQLNEIIKHQFSYYFTELNRLIPQIAKSDFLHFLLFQYDQTSEIDGLYKSRSLSPSDDKRWGEIGPIMRRTIKYLAERTVLLDDGKGSKPNLSKAALSQGLDFLGSPGSGLAACQFAFLRTFWLKDESLEASDNLPDPDEELRNADCGMRN